jgi:hypothetical protein
MGESFYPHSPGAKPRFLHRLTSSFEESDAACAQSKLNTAFAVVLGAILHRLHAYITASLGTPAIVIGAVLRAGAYLGRT